MKHQETVGTDKDQANPYSSSSLVPMLVAGLVLIFFGMIVAVLLS